MEKQHEPAEENKKDVPSPPPPPPLEKSSWGVDEDSQPLEVVTAETALDPVSPSTAKTVSESMLIASQHDPRANKVVTRALILVNCQNDFFEGGSAAVPKASDILPNIKILRQHKFDLVIHCQEWRPSNDSSFYSNNPGATVNEIHHYVGGRTQTIYMDHCIQGTQGANFHKEVYVDPEDLVVRTGYNPEVDSYSAFRQSDSSGVDRIIHMPLNEGNITPNSNELCSYLSKHNVTHIFVCGLGADRSILYTALDAKERMRDVNVYFIEDASKPYEDSKMFGVYEKFQRSRVMLTKVHSKEINDIPLRYKAHEIRSDKPGSALQLSLPSNVLDTDAWNKYYNELLDNLDERFTLVELAYIRMRAKKLHPMHSFPPMPSIEILDDIGIHSVEQIMSPHMPRQQNVLQVVCTTGDHEFLKKILDEASATGRFAIDLHHKYTINAMERTLLNIALDNNFPGHRIRILSLLLHYAKALPAGNNKQIDTKRHDESNADIELLVNVQDRPSQMTPLMYACLYGDVAVTSKLLENGADVNLKNQFGRTALMFACENDSPANIEICRLILAGVSTVMRRYRLLIDQDSQGWNSLHFASKSGMFTKLPWDSLMGGEIYAKMHLQYHRKTMEGLTILHLSAWNNRADVVRYIVSPYDDTFGGNSKHTVSSQNDPDRTGNTVETPDNDVKFADSQQASRTDYVSVPLAPILRQMPPNQLIPKSKMTELDVAVASGYYEAALCLASQRYRSPGKPMAFHCNVFAGEPLQKLLYRAILAGHVDAVRGLFRFRCNKLPINPLMLSVTRKMKYKDTCTFTFAAYNSPSRQPCWMCGNCNVKVCIVCKDKCHTSHKCKSQLRFLGIDDSVYCECSSRIGHTTCKALSGVDQKELQSYEFKPKPIDVSDEAMSKLGLKLNEKIIALSEMISVNMHEEWSLEKVANGWTYNAIRDDDKLHHNCLVPWYKLLPEDKQYDYETSTDTIKAIVLMGFNLEEMSDDEFNNINHGDADIFEEKILEDGTLEKHIHRVRTVEALNKIMLHHWKQDLKLYQSENEQIAEEVGVSVDEETFESFTYNPHPFDLSFITIPHDLDELVDALARNAHDTWASAKIDSGWTYGSETDAENNKNHLLVSYDMLPSEVQASNVRNIYGIIKTIMYLGWKFVKRGAVGNAIGSVSKPAGPDEAHVSRGNSDAAKLAAKLVASSNAQNASNALLASVARRDSTGMSEENYEAMRQEEANLQRIKQDLLDTYLLAASQLNDCDIIDELLHARDGERAQINCVNAYGHSPLYLSVKLGHIESAEKLLSLEARSDQCCHLGLSPLMVASALGNTRMVQLLYEMGGNIFAKDLRAGFTPLHYAAYKGKVNTCKYITSHIIGLGKGGLNNMYVKQGSKDDDASASNIRLPDLNIQSLAERHHLYAATNLKNASSKYAHRVNQMADGFNNGGLVSHRVRSLTNQVDLQYNKDLCGYTPLSVAVKNGKWKIAGILIEGEADPMQKDGTNKRPYERALRKLDNIEDLILVLEEEHSNYSIHDDINDANLVGRKRGNVDDAHNPTSCMDKLRLQCAYICCSSSARVQIDNEQSEDPHLEMRHKLQPPPKTRENNESKSTKRSAKGLARLSTIRDLTRFRDSTRLMKEALNEFDNTVRNLDTLGNDQVLASPTKVAFSYKQQKREKKLLRKALHLRQNLRALISVLNKAESVAFHRNIYAMRTALVNCIIFLIILLVVVIILLPNVSNPNPYELSNYLKSTVEKEYTTRIIDRNSWFDWHIETLYPGNEKAVQDSQLVESLITSNATRHATNSLNSLAGINTFLDENILIGKVAVQMYNELPQDCPIPYEGFVSKQKVCYPRRKIINFGTYNANEAELKKLHPYPPFKDGNDNGGSTSRMIGLQLSTTNLTDAILVLKGLKVNSNTSYGYPTWFIHTGTTAVDTYINVYNPTLEIFAAIRARTIFGPTGYAYHDVQAYSFQLGYGTSSLFNVLHPPSTAFQICIGLIALVVVMKFFPSCFRRGMSLSEIFYNIYNKTLLKIYLVLCILCVVVIMIDFDIARTLSIAPMKKDSVQYMDNENMNVVYYYEAPSDNIFLDLWDIGAKLRLERDWLSIMILFNGLAMIMNTQYIPLIGPLVFAIGTTIFHRDVLIFLVLYGLIMFVISVTFVISFGSELQNYSTLGESFMSLFHVPFAEQYDNVLFDDAGSGDNDSGGEGIRFIYSIMYLIIAMMTTNLFIAIVTQVFPQERERSTQNWDGNITKDLQQIERRKRLEREQKKLKNASLQQRHAFHQQYRSVMKLQNKPFSDLLKDSVFMSYTKKARRASVDLSHADVLQHEDYDHKNARCGLHVYMRNDRLFEGENGFEYWTHKGLHSSIDDARGGGLDGSSKDYASDKIMDELYAITSDESSDDDEEGDGDGPDIFEPVTQLEQKLKTESTISGHRKGYNSKRDAAKESSTWSKVQLNMADQELRLKQLQNHINAIEITITGLTNMSRETLEINQELAHHQDRRYEDERSGKETSLPFKNRRRNGAVLNIPEK